MKIKQLKAFLLTGTCLLACLACSKDDDSKIDTMADAKLTVTIKAAGVKTKAYNPDDKNELQGEANINNLAVIVFSADGSEVYGARWEPVQTEYTATLADVPARSNNARIVIVANIPENVVDGITSYAGFQSVMVDLASQSQTSLAMSSRVIDTDKPLIAGDNYLGYTSMGDNNVNGISSPIYLTRVASRIDLVSVDTKFAGTKLEGNSVRVEQVSVINRKTQAHYFSEAEWGAVEVDGKQDNSPVVSLNATINDANSLTGTNYIVYVMENSDATTPTSIQIKASLVNASGNIAQTKTFTSPINLNGVNLGYGHNLVKRNYVYRVWVTFGENSFDPEEPTSLIVRVEVVDWGQVYQDVVID